jgi:hypothetical protein
LPRILTHDSSGTVIMKLHFGRKLFGYIFMLLFCTISCPQKTLR